MAYRFIFLGLTCLVASCASVPAAQHTALCETEIAQLDVDFDGAAAASCVAVGNVFTLQIAPEDTPINPSPWYAVRLTPASAGEVILVLDYAPEGWHRYHPKVSADGETWTDLSPERVQLNEDESQARIRVTVDDTPLYVAGQELYTSEDYDVWMSALAAQPDVTEDVIGQSIEGRPIKALRHSAGLAGAKTVFLVGRQHPPEVTGGLAMKHFIAELFGDTETAITFRDRFNIVMVPLLNPDGVANGHWRHNRGGVDLNRDWGPFTQPETQAVASLLDDIASEPNEELVLFLDFHSTWDNVFYTQSVEDEPTAYNFTEQWIAAGQRRVPDYDVEYAPSDIVDMTVSKNYIYSRFSVPAITYEVGDTTDRGLINTSASVYADEMMKLLLKNE